MHLNKQIIIVFFLLNNYYCMDFYDKLCSQLRSIINLVPTIYNNSQMILSNKYTVAITALPFIYLTINNKRSIPIYRSIEKIKELNKEKSVDETIKKIQNMDKNCLLTIVQKYNFKNEKDEKIITPLKQLLLYDRKIFYKLMYPKQMRKNNIEDFDGLIAELSEDCILTNILKEIKNNEQLSLNDWFLLNCTYVPMCSIAILDLLFVPSFFLYLYNMFNK